MHYTLVSGTWNCWKPVIPVKTAKKIFSISAFFIATEDHVPIPAHWCGPAFRRCHFADDAFVRTLSFCLIISFARFNSMWALAFLTSFLHAPTVSQVTCPCFHLLSALFLKLSFASRSLFIHVGILSFFFPCLVVRILSFLSLQEMILENSAALRDPSAVQDNIL